MTEQNTRLGIYLMIATTFVFAVQDGISRHLAGEYNVIPPTGQEFYFPEVYGRGDGSLFTITGEGLSRLFWTLFIILAGVSTYRSIPKESQPDVQIPYIYVSMTHEGISPEDAERLLVRPMEQEMRALEGVKEMTSSAYEGGANVTMEFDAGIDTDIARINSRSIGCCLHPPLVNVGLRFGWTKFDMPIREDLVWMVGGKSGSIGTG